MVVKILHGRKASQITASDGNLWVSALFFAFRLPQKSGQKVNESICLAFLLPLCLNVKLVTHNSQLPS